MSRRPATPARVAAALLLCGGLLSGTVPAGASAAGAATPWPATIALPTGFQPEGIDIGPGPVAYIGSLADGSIYRADLRTGRGRVLSPAVGSPSVGLERDDRGRLYVAGGPTGTARVLDTTTGALLADVRLADPGSGSAVNDVVLTGGAAYFTDSTLPVLHRVPVGRSGRPVPQDVEAIPYRGAMTYDDDPATFEANGIETTPDGEALLVVQTRTGLLFRVDPGTGDSVRVDLGGALLAGGDGLTRRGRDLHVVQPSADQVTVLRLSHDGRTARVRARVTDDALDVPTTVAVAGDRLYLPNARFGTTSPETAAYQVVGIDRP